MIGKLIAHGETRQGAIARMNTALSELIIDGYLKPTFHYSRIL